MIAIIACALVGGVYSLSADCKKYAQGLEPIHEYAGIGEPMVATLLVSAFAVVITNFQMRVEAQEIIFKKQEEDQLWEAENREKEQRRQSLQSGSGKYTAPEEEEEEALEEGGPPVEMPEQQNAMEQSSSSATGFNSTGGNLNTIEE